RSSSLGKVSVYDVVTFRPADLRISAMLSGGADSPAGVAHEVSTVSSPRQISVGPGSRTLCRSVVSAGIVQVRRTLPPLRVARRSVGGFGNWSEGGCGGP